MCHDIIDLSSRTERRKSRGARKVRATMNDQESQAIEDFLAAEAPAEANASIVDVAKKSVSAWAATRSTSIPAKSIKDKSRIAAPKDIAFKAITALTEQLSKAKAEGALLSAARRLMPFLKRSSGTHTANGKQPRPSGTGR